MTARTAKKAKVPKNKPLPKKKAAPPSSGGAGDAALVAVAGASRGRSNFLCKKVQEIESIEEKKRQLGKQINGLYAEIKGNGFAVKAVRSVVALRRMDKEERAHHEENVAIVKEALGEQLTLWDKAASGETREPVEAEDDAAEASCVPDPEAIAMKRASVSSIEQKPLH